MHHLRCKESYWITKNVKCISRKHGNYLVVVTMEESVNSSSNIVAILIVGIYLTSASCLLVLMLSRVLKEKYEKRKIYVYFEYGYGKVRFKYGIGLISALDLNGFKTSQWFTWT